MKNIKKTFLLLLFSFLLFSKVSFSQHENIDSLKLFISTSADDTNKVNALNWLAKNYISQSRFDTAITCGSAALELAKKLNFKQGYAPAYVNMGIAYQNFGNFPKALENYLAGLKVDEELGNKLRVGRNLSNIATIYKNMGEYEKGLNNNYKALAIFEELKNTRGIAAVCNNMGSIYNEQNNYVKALEYYRKALSIDQSLANRSIRYGAIGILYQETDQLDSAEFYYKIALAAAEDNNSQTEIGRYKCNLGSVYITQKKYKDAEKLLLDALEIFEKTGYLEGLQESHSQLSKLYEAMGDTKNALKFYKLYIENKDSLFNQDKNEELVRNELNYEFDKKQAQAESESKKQRLLLILIACIAFAVSLSALIIFRSLRITRKQKKIIEAQKGQVEQKQVEILDSIRYAKRIQKALLPTEKYIDKNLKRLK